MLIPHLYPQWALPKVRYLVKDAKIGSADAAKIA